MADGLAAAQVVMTPEDLLNEHTPKVRGLAEALRLLVKATVPHAVEKAYPGWNGLGYRLPESGYFCSLFPHEDRVHLGFEFGVLLPDPDGLLEGEGKQVRYVTVREEADIAVKSIEKLLMAAISLPRARESMLAMIRALARPVDN